MGFTQKLRIFTTEYKFNMFIKKLWVYTVIRVIVLISFNEGSGFGLSTLRSWKYYLCDHHNSQHFIINFLNRFHLKSTSESCEWEGNISLLSSMVWDSDLGMMDLLKEWTKTLFRKLINFDFNRVLYAGDW